MYIRVPNTQFTVGLRALSLVAFFGVAFLATAPAQAQQMRRVAVQNGGRMYYQYQYVTPARPTYVQPAQQPARTAAVAPQQTGDAGSFLNWLNATRAQYGLAAVGYDQNLANWAQQNNAEQTRRGIGHYVMGPARRQNSAMGPGGNIGAMWMASPAHRAALLDPSIRWIGLAGWGAYWTFNAL